MSDERLKPAPETEDGLYLLLEKASQQDIIVIFGPDGMTVDEIVKALRCTEHVHKLMIIGDPPRTLPGGKNLVN